MADPTPCTLALHCVARQLLILGLVEGFILATLALSCWFIYRD
jgi:hypothetical protein